MRPEGRSRHLLRSLSAAAAVLLAPFLASCSRSTSPVRAPSTLPSAISRPVAKPLPPPAFAVGVRTLTLTDTTRPTFDYATSPPAELTPYRTIVTQIRYPIFGHHLPTGREAIGAAPARADGPFPVIVFAHGYAVTPNAYEGLLDSWVRSGFVVVAPVFPVSNYFEWVRQGRGGLPEEDVGNQPADVAFVVRRLSALASGRSSFLHGLGDFRRLGLAGQSDGATTVGGLEFSGPFWAAWASMPVHPVAVAILSGAEFDGSLFYADPLAAPPALLSVESDGDHCNPMANATALYNAVAGRAAAHWFLTLHGADHVAPYFGVEPWAGVVSRVTTDFFQAELARRAPTAQLSRAGDVVGVSTISDTAEVNLPDSTPLGECGTPLPGPPLGA